MRKGKARQTLWAVVDHYDPGDALPDEVCTSKGAARAAAQKNIRSGYTVNGAVLLVKYVLVSAEEITA